jgi:hypothetical protein
MIHIPLSMYTLPILAALGLLPDMPADDKAKSVNACSAPHRNSPGILKFSTVIGS